MGNELAYNRIYTVKTCDLFLLFLINGKYLVVDKVNNGYLIEETIGCKVHFDDVLELLDYVDTRIRTENNYPLYWN